MLRYDGDVVGSMSANFEYRTESENETDVYLFVTTALGMSGKDGEEWFSFDLDHEFMAADDTVRLAVTEEGESQ